MLVGMQTCSATLEISMVLSQKTGNQSTLRPSYITCGHISKRCSIIPQGHVFIMFIAALFVITGTWKQPRCPSTKEWIKKMWYVYTMEYYTAVKNNDIRKFEDKWMELEKIILNEVTQTQKDKHGMVCTHL